MLLNDVSATSEPAGSTSSMGVPALVFYTVNHKKRDILFLTITLANLNRFLQFLYYLNREEILHATVVKFTIYLNCVCTVLRKFK